MNWNMIYLLTANNMSFSESFGYAMRMLIVGLGMVFAVLAILWAVLEISRVAFYEAPKRRREAEVAEHKAEVRTAPAVASAAPAPAPVVAPKNDDVLIAVITAAVAAAMAEEGTSPATGFRVVSFRRTGGNHAWNRK